MTPEQANTIAMPIKEQDNFRAIFFIMTICVGKVGYMSAEQLRTLSDRGNAIEVHNYDHPSMKNIMDSLWEMQLGKPKVFLEKITQKPVYYSAYPNGFWTENLSCN